MSFHLSFEQKQLFDHLYQDNFSWLYHWLLKNLKQSESAEDVAQDTFEKVLHGQFTSTIQHPKSFLAKIATRIVIDQARRKKIEQAYLEYLTTNSTEYDLDSPENLLLAVELLDRLAKMLDGLEDYVRQIFLLRYIDRMTQAEIAERLNLSRRVVQLALIKALKHCDDVVEH